MKRPHTATFRGRRVLIVLKDGSRVTGKFLDRASRFVFLEGEAGKLQIDISSIKAFTPVKDQHRNRR